MEEIKRDKRLIDIESTTDLLGIIYGFSEFLNCGDYFSN